MPTDKEVEQKRATAAKDEAKAAVSRVKSDTATAAKSKEVAEAAQKRANKA